MEEPVHGLSHWALRAKPYQQLQNDQKLDGSSHLALLKLPSISDGYR